MELVQCSNVTYDYGAGALLRGVSLRILAGERLGLIGPNGCGKTTLARLISGELEPVSGSVSRRNGQTILNVPQDYEGAPEVTVRSFMLGKMLEIEGAMRESEERMGGLVGPENEKALARELARYEQLTERYNRAGGPQAESLAERALARVGLAHLLPVEMGLLSGGERNLVLIAKALSADPDLIIMDEPGNHLDLAGLDWLESVIRGLECAVLIISHNRYLLDRTVHAILEFDSGKVARYAGGYSRARMEKLRAGAAQGAQYQADRKRVARLEKLVSRLAEEARNQADPAKGKQLRARRTQLATAREEAAEAPGLSPAKPAVELAGVSTKSDVAIEVSGYTRTIGDDGRVLFDDAHLTVLPGERVGIVGSNGCGKTTFLRDLAELGAWEHPTLRVGPSLNVGVLYQDGTGFEQQRSLIDAFQEWTDLSLSDARALLGRYLFSVPDLEKPLHALSGGERNRLQIARLVAQRATLLLLDEPTNHLDIPAREAVEDGLTEFDGTVIAVSHDRYFLDAIATRIVEVDSLRLTSYPSGFSEFWRVRGSAFRRPSGSRAAVDSPSTPPSRAPSSIESRIIALEEEQQELERRIVELQERRDFARAKTLGAKLERLTSTIEDLWRRW